MRKHDPAASAVEAATGCSWPLAGGFPELLQWATVLQRCLGAGRGAVSASMATVLQRCLGAGRGAVSASMATVLQRCLGAGRGELVPQWPVLQMCLGVEQLVPQWPRSCRGAWEPAVEQVVPACKPAVEQVVPQAARGIHVHLQVYAPLRNSGAK